MTETTTGTDWLDPGSCAVVVVDVQNDFCHPDGALARMGNDVSGLQPMMAGIERLLAAARIADVPRIYVRTGLSEWFEDPAWRRRGQAGDVFDAERVPVVQEGTWGAELYRLAPRPDELVLTKYRYSAFAHTPLELVLRSRDRTTVVLAGTATHQCVEATARDAIGRGFYPVLVADASASRDSRFHDMAVEDFAAHLGTVTDAEALGRHWASAVGDREAAVAV